MNYKIIKLHTTIAIPLRHYMNESNLVLKLWCMCDVIEMILRLSSIIGISYLNNYDLLGQEHKKKIKLNFDLPTFGKWNENIILISNFSEKKYYKNNKWIDGIKQISENIKKFIYDNQEQDRLKIDFKFLRNRLAHYGRMSDKKAFDLLEYWNPKFQNLILNDLNWFNSFELISKDDKNNYILLKSETPSYIQSYECYNKKLLDENKGTVILSEVPQKDNYISFPLWPFTIFDKPNQFINPIQNDSSSDKLLTQIYSRKESTYLEYIPLGSDMVYGNESDEKAFISYETFFNVNNFDNVFQSNYDEKLNKEVFDFTGRRKDILKILKSLNYAVKTGNNNFLLINGPAGIGKSYLNSYIASFYLNKIKPAKKIILPYRFISNDKTYLYFDDFLNYVHQKLLWQIKIKYESYILKEYCEFKPNESLENKLNNIKKMIYFLTESSFKILFIIDGIDELIKFDKKFKTEIILQISNPSTIWLFAGRPEPEVMKFSEELKCEQIFPNGLKGMSENDIRQMILRKIDTIKPLREMLIKMDSLSVDEEVYSVPVKNQFISKVELKAKGLPLYVKFVIEDIINKRVIIGSEPDLPNSLEEYYTKLINRYNVGDLQQLITPLICLLTLTKEPLTFDEIYEFLYKRELLLYETNLHKALLAINPLVNIKFNQSNKLVYSLYHNSLCEFFKKSELNKESLKLFNNFICKQSEISNFKNSKIENYIIKWGISHLIDNEKPDQIIKLLTDIDFLELKVKSGNAFNLLKDFSDSLEFITESNSSYYILKLINKALRNNIHFINAHYIDYPQSLFQSIWNSGWWYDGRNDSNINETKYKTSFFNKVLEKWHQKKIDDDPDFFWLRANRPPLIPLNSPLTASIESDIDTLRYINFMPFESKLLSAGYDNSGNSKEDYIVKIWSVNDLSESSYFKVNCVDDNIYFSRPGNDKREINYNIESSFMSIDGSKIAFSIIGEINYYDDDDNFIESELEYKIKIYDIKNSEYTTIYLKNNKIFAFCFSPDCNHIAVSLIDKIIIYNIVSKLETKIISISESSHDICFSPNGEYIVLLTSCAEKYKNKIFLFDLKCDKYYSNFDYYCNVNTIKISSDSKIIVFNDNDSIVILDMLSLTEINRLKEHKDVVLDICFSPDNSKLVSTGRDKLIIIWDFKESKINNIFSGSEKPVSKVCYSDNGDLIASTDGNKIRFWEPMSETKYDIPSGHYHSINNIYHSAKNDIFATFDENGLLIIWNSKSGKLIYEFKIDKNIRDVFVLDEDNIAVLHEENLVEFIDLINKAKPLYIKLDEKEDVTKIRFSSDKKQIAYIAGYKIRLFDRITQKKTLADVFEKYDYIDICFSKDQKFLFTNTIDNKTIKIDLNTFELKNIIDERIDIFLMSCECNYRVYKNNNEIIVKSLADQSVLGYFNTSYENIRNLNSSFLITSSGRHVQIISLEKG